ncbi:MAG TPA: DNA mismatch repair endonuclease MutL [Candidatus Dojkabacteria bacterium]|nr:DNA mismatch repair endonuclease MutL [Candidatus Dojkabacteria bacterium]
MTKIKLNKLSKEVINQIAAGEVIERPSSVVKELVDNSIDAGAGKITVKVKNGGIDMIEVSDDGIGIPKENLGSIFEPHTTTKISNIEDLNTLLSMGFRGEALSTITSVSKVRLNSKYEGEERGNEILFDENGQSDITTVAKEKGTTVCVENIFYNIPARKKYLKTAATEYRKIYEMLCRYFLIYPNIAFTLEKDGKVVVNLKALGGSKAGELEKERITGVLGKNVDEEMLEVAYNGAGTRISGYISHPSLHKSKSSNQYLFINNRPVSDRGVVRAIMEGYSRYLPFGQKVDFVLNIHIDPEFVDVNVHPRKEEVRFENPYRIYSAVEEAVRHALEKSLSYRKESKDDTIYEKPKATTPTDFSSLRERFNQPHTSSKSKEYTPRNIYSGGKSSSVQDSLLFSSELLKDTPVVEHVEEETTTEGDIRGIFQVFNKYIVIEFHDERLWVIDQHAAAERINFEKLKNRETKSNLQNLLVPSKIDFPKNELMFLDENKEFFEDLGFIYEVNKDSISLKTIPAEYSESDYTEIFKEIFELEENVELLKKSFTKRKDDVLATIACHGSIRSGQKLSFVEMKDLFETLLKCENPYSCPHGRPIVWKMTLREIDSNFERTY